MIVMDMTKNKTRKKYNTESKKKMQEQIDDMEQYLKHGHNHPECKSHKHLIDLNTEESIRILQKDPIVWAIIDGPVLEEIRDVEVSGRDIMTIDQNKLEDWWKIDDPDKRQLVFEYLDDVRKMDDVTSLLN